MSRRSIALYCTFGSLQSGVVLRGEDHMSGYARIGEAKERLT